MITINDVGVVDSLTKPVVTYRPATRLDLLLALGLVETCPTCDHVGLIDPGGEKERDCPDCVGGVTLNEERIEVAAKAIPRHHNDEFGTDDYTDAEHLDLARAAVLEFLLEGEKP